MALNIYVAVAAVVTIIDLFCAFLTKRSHRKNTQYFCYTLLAAACMQLFYTLAVTIPNYFCMKLFLGLYFSSISMTLMLLLTHIISFVGEEITKARKIRIGIGWSLVCLDIVCELLNPFFEFALHFEYHPENTVDWVFLPQLPYQLHLVLCYLLIINIIVIIFRKIFRTPYVFRPKYYTIITAIMVAVVFNAFCLLFQPIGLPDYSMTSYSFLAVILYWDLFHNSQQEMAHLIRQVIIDQIGLPIILFGEENRLAAKNRSAQSIIPDTDDNLSDYTLHDFISAYQLDPDLEAAETNRTFQWIHAVRGGTENYRVDFRVLWDKHHQKIGRLFVFADNSLAIDPLTGFHSQTAMTRYTTSYADKSHSGGYFPATVAVFDINRLSSINRDYGTTEGDKCIAYLANTLRKYCGSEAFYARLSDANLMVMSRKITLSEMRDLVVNIQKECEQPTMDIVSFGIQYAMSTTDAEQPDITTAVNSAIFSMRSRKMMDKSSAHSSLLDSMAMTLMEADETTEAHVQRTQALGEKLGQRLHLSDLDLSNLSLLCLLHDIGKLGIPLEILVKPGRLTANEWEVMKTHVTKGYRIARASAELTPIADYILYHHERWDGQGYPHGLARESIPLLSRIISIVDAYDAMTNDRPYHKAISEEAARAELQRCAGHQFDPTLVSEFMDLLNELHPVSDETMQQAIKDNQDVHEVAQESRISLDRDLMDHLSQIRIVHSSEYTLSENHEIISIDNTFTDLTGYTKEDLKVYNLTQWDLIPPDSLETYRELAMKLLRVDGRVFLEHRLRRKDGSLIYVLCYGEPMTPVNDSRERYQLRVIDAHSTMFVDTMNREYKENNNRMIKQWNEVLRHDSMTKVLNHEAFLNDVSTAIQSTNDIPVFLILDMDFFKSFNDSYGHVAGDKLLTAMAGALMHAVDGNGFAGRVGGDEFAAFFTIPKDQYSKINAEQRVAHIHADITRTISAFSENNTLSIGAVAITGTRKSLRKIYENADKLLYQSKDRGRNTFTFDEYR